MIRINLAKKQVKGAGGLDLKNLSLQSLIAMLRRDDGEGVKFDFNNPLVKAAIAFVVCYFAGDFLEGMKAEELKKLDAQVEAVGKEQEALAAKLAKIKGFEPIKKQLEDDEKAIRLKLDIVRKLLDDRTAPAKILLQIAQSIPEEVWLTSLDVTEDLVKIAGQTSSYNQVSDFIKALNGTSQFADINLSGIQEASGGPESARVQTFDLTAKRGRHN